MANGTIAFDTLSTSGQITGTAKSVDTDYLAYGSAKAWFHIVNGAASTIALGDSFNAANSSGITDGGTGIYNFNFGSNMANANYSLTMGSQAASGFPDKPQINSQATGSFQCRQAHASDEVDAAIYNATVNGDLA